MRKIWTVIFIVVETLVCGMPLMAQVNGPDLKNATLGLLKNKPNPKLRVTAWPDLHTRVLYTYGNSNVLVPARARKIFIFLTGTGGSAKEKGIQGSVSVPAIDLFNAGNGKAAVIGLENPLYYEWEKGQPTRQPWLDRYSDIQNQLAWLNDALEYIISLAHPEAEIIVVGRSTGTALINEAIQRRIPVIHKIHDVVTTGWVPHSEEAIEKWYAEEYKLRLIDPTCKDIPVSELGPVLFRGLTFGFPQKPQRSDRPMPKMHAVISGNDIFVHWNDQEALISQFAANNPDLDIDEYYTDAGHSVDRGFTYTAKPSQPGEAPFEVIVQQMDRMKRRLFPILKRTERSEYSAGLKPHYEPEWKNIVGNHPSEDCVESIRMAGSAPTSIDDVDELTAAAS